MSNPVVIVHGWSDEGANFLPIAEFLRDHLGRDVELLNLADWVSLDDEITYRDLRHAVSREWRRKRLPTGPRTVDVVTHSTGALVMRDWMTSFYGPQTVPIHRMVMLAPANFGSFLAHRGRAWYGRLFKGARTGGQTGTHLLKGLELASPYTVELAQRDVFSTNRWYGKDRVLGTVLVGNSGYDGVKKVLSEDGGDGTVRISTANLNAARLTLDLTREQPGLTVNELII